jgi:hypothetical protein
MQPSSRNGNSLKSVVQQLDRRANGLNAFLLVLAIGLATLDATCFAALKLSAFYAGLLATHAGDSTATSGRR